MANEPSVVKGSREGFPALDEREFSLARNGYDREQVKAYLAEIEANLRELEDWAVRTKARLALAEEKNDAVAGADEAMVAVFEAKERVLAKARLQGEKLQAEARDMARADAEVTGAEIIAEAREEALRIVRTAMATTIPATEDELLESARGQADRLIQQAREEAARVTHEARNEAAGEQDPLAPSREAMPEDGEGHEYELSVVIDDRDLEERPSRYERNSAGLPSIGDDASNVVKLMERLRKKP